MTHIKKIVMGFGSGGRTNTLADYIPATHLNFHSLHTYIQPTLLHTLHSTHLHTSLLYKPTPTNLQHPTPYLHTNPTNAPAPDISILPLHAYKLLVKRCWTLLLDQSVINDKTRYWLQGLIRWHFQVGRLHTSCPENPSNWCFFYYFVRDSLVVVLEALCARLKRIDLKPDLCSIVIQRTWPFKLIFWPVCSWHQKKTKHISCCLIVNKLFWFLKDTLWRIFIIKDESEHQTEGVINNWLHGENMRTLDCPLYACVFLID